MEGVVIEKVPASVVDVFKKRCYQYIIQVKNRKDKVTIIADKDFFDFEIGDMVEITSKKVTR